MCVGQVDKNKISYHLAHVQKHSVVVWVGALVAASLYQ